MNESLKEYQQAIHKLQEQANFLDIEFEHLLIFGEIINAGFDIGCLTALDVNISDTELGNMHKEIGVKHEDFRKSVALFNVYYDRKKKIDSILR
jgi:hypothetical protein